MPILRVSRVLWFLLIGAMLLLTGGAAGASLPAASLPAASAPADCGSGRKLLFFSAHPLLDAKAGAGFADSLRRQLREPLLELGYCLSDIKDYRTLLDTARFADNLVLHTLVSEGPDPVVAAGTGSGTLLVAVLNVRDWSAGKLPEAVSRPLVSLRFHAPEAATLPNIVVKKISENLRSQFVAQLLIQSRPAGVRVRSDAGLEGATPVEWIVPLGNLSVTLEKPGYVPMRRDLDLSSPGMHAFEMQLSKRRFYNSKLIYPALFFGAATGVAFVFENQYYSRYRDLGAADQQDHPEKFADTFRTAKSFERLGYTSLALAATSLVFSFRF